MKELFAHIIETVDAHLLVNSLAVATLCALIVFVAMGIDLVSGWYKARLRGEAHTSTALGRTVMKLLVYEGSLMITGGIDIMITLSHLWQLVGMPMLACIPMITIIWAVFLCGIEWISVREKADEKAKKHINNAAKLGIEIAEEILASKGIRIDLNHDGKEGEYESE